jgi:sugar (pentulose or hexulose) kinase
MTYVLGIDIGTASSKAIAVDESGEVRATEQLSHEISRPRMGWTDHDPAVWWREVASLSRQIVAGVGESPAAVCVSGMGPCLAPATEAGALVRAAILYGIDTRAEAEIAALSDEIGEDELLVRGGSRLSSQAIACFAGERTPIFDPHARGTLLGLTLSHGRAQIMRAFLEGVALGVRHKLAAFDEVSPPAARHVSVGGGARTPIWPQIVSDASGITQLMPRHTVGAVLGDAMFAATVAGIAGSDRWNAIERTVEPNHQHTPLYAQLFAKYQQAYLDTRDVTHALVQLNQPRNMSPIPAQASPTER